MEILIPTKMTALVGSYKLTIDIDMPSSGRLHLPSGETVLNL
jgi:hypothetical protein